MNTDAYHNFLITGGPARDDLPSTPSEALDEWEGNLLSVCEEIGVEFTPEFMEKTMFDLIKAWRKSGVGEALLISECGWDITTTTVLKESGESNVSGLLNRLSQIGTQSTRRGRAPVISIVYGQENLSN